MRLSLSLPSLQSRRDFLAGYIRSALPHASSALVDAIANAATTVAAADLVAPESIVDSLALNTYLWVAGFDQCFTDATGTILAGAGNAVRSIRCAKSGMLIVAPAATNSATLTASDGLDFAVDDNYALPDLSQWSSGTAVFVVRADFDPPATEQRLARFSFASGGSYPGADGIIYDDFGINSVSDRGFGNPVPSLASTFRLWMREAASGTNGQKGYLDTVLMAQKTFAPTFLANPSLGTNGTQFFNGNLKFLSLRNAIFSAGDRTTLNKLLKQLFSLTGY